MDIIYTHAHCQDGWVAAYVAKLKYPEAEIVPLEHYPNQAWILDRSRDKDVLMLDFALKTREQNDELASVCKSFRLIDHHKTAKEAVDGASYAFFDMDRSGAGLAWDLLFGLLVFKDGVPTGEVLEAVDSKPRPWWVNYTEAQDLWRWESFPNSKPIAGYLRTVPFTIEAWDSIRTTATVNSVYTLGLGVQAMIDYEVREVLQRVADGFLAGHTCGVVNAGPNRAQICSEIIKKYDIALGWFDRGYGPTEIQFFLCSSKVDVGEIAKKLGGGGHKNAAGFEKSLVQGRKLIDDITGRNDKLLSSQAVPHE